MDDGRRRIHHTSWTLGLIAVIVAFLFATGAGFKGTFDRNVSVTLKADRAGLVMDTDSKVMLRGVQVGRVGEITAHNNLAGLKLEISPDQIRYIPANVQARIKATTLFGTKFVELVYPQDPTDERLTQGAVLHSSNVSAEVNTVFEDVVDLLKMIDPLKLNGVLTAVAEGVRGQGERMGQATTGLHEVLTALNARSDTMREDWRSLKNATDAYGEAASDIVAILDAASTTSDTVVNHAAALDSVLLNVVGFSNAGTELLGSSKDNLVAAVNTLEPTTNLLLKYSPTYACMMQGATHFLDNGGRDAWGGDGRSLIFDFGLSFGNDPYVYPDNLPLVEGKGGPDGKPSCGSLPDVAKNFPVRQLITNTGWGTGLDIRPNPGIGRPCYANYLPVTRAEPKPPSIRQCLPGPAPGPVPYPGAPPYGAPLYGPGGVPLWPGVAPAPPPPAPAPADADPAAADGGAPPTP